MAQLNATQVLSVVEMMWFNGLEFVVVRSQERGRVLFFTGLVSQAPVEVKKPLFQPFWSTILSCGTGLAKGQGLLSFLGNTRDV